VKSNNETIVGDADSAAKGIWQRAVDYHHLRQMSLGIEESLHQILEMLPEFVWISGPDGEFEYLSQSILDYVGMTFEAMKANWRSVLHPADIEACMQAIAEGLGSGKVLERELRVRRFDGLYRWFYSRTRALRDEQGNVIRWYGITWDIDERKKAEKAVHQSERELRLIIDTIPALVCTAKPDGSVDYLSQRIVDYFGVAAEDLYGAGWVQVVHPDDADAAMRGWMQAVALGTSYEATYRHRSADGQYRWFQVRTEPLRDHEGHILQWYGLLFDIDDQQRAEEALRESENSLRQIIETIPAFVFRTARGGETDYMNQRIVEYTGKSLQEVQESGGWAQLVHPDERDAMLQKKQSCIEKGESYENVYRFRRADGQYRWFQIRVEPLRDKDGRVAHWYGLFFDIDDQKRVEAALRESENSLRQIIETIPAFVFRTAPGGELDYVNQRVVEYAGKSLLDVGAWGWTQLIHPDDVEAALRKRRTCIETGESYENVYRFRRADGQYRWFQIRAQPLRDQDGSIAHWYGLFLDIDDRQRAEEMLRTTQARLSRATQIATVAELSAAIAHEINQPLAAIIANADALNTRLSHEPPKLKRAQLIAERIIRDGNSAAEVVRRIRALFKEATPTIEALDINHVITDVLTLERAELRKKGIKVATDLEGDLPITLGDAIQIRQVIINLVQNGVDAMESVSEGSKCLSICSRWDGINILIEVCDQGSGLKDVKKAFEPFFTTKKKGMGMGLAICRSIIEAHDGQLSTTTSAQGTTFQVTLPIRLEERKRCQIWEKERSLQQINHHASTVLS
jgi:PAS domain S-box-containing protein